MDMLRYQEENVCVPTLKHARIDTWRSLDKNAFRALHARQRQLQNLRVEGCWTASDSPLLGSSMDGIPLHLDNGTIKCLQLYVKDDSGTTHALLALSLVAGLERLELEVDMQKYCRSKDMDYGNTEERSRAAECIALALFDKQHPLVRASGWKEHPRPLSLCINGLDLRYAAAILLENISVIRLSLLTVQNCGNPDAFFHGLQSQEHRLRTMVTAACFSDEWPATWLSMNNLLVSFQGLETLVVCHPTSTHELGLEAVVHHASTLQMLYINFPGQAAYPSSQVERLFTNFKRLEQMALPLPVSGLEDEHLNDRPELASYLVSFVMLSPVSFT